MIYKDGKWDGEYIDGLALDNILTGYFPTLESTEDFADVPWRALYEARG